MKELIRKLTEAYGPSGNEGAVRQLIREEIEGLVDEVRVDALGNLIAVKKPKAGDGFPRVMLAAHMDEIGLMVTHIDEKGFLRFAFIGAVFPLVLVGSRVVFENGVTGVIGVEKRPEEVKEVPRLEKLYLDVGAKDRASCPVKVGDAAVFVRPFVDLGERVVAKALDDRIGCAILIQTIKELKKVPQEVAFVFTAQEEVGRRGAKTSAYGLAPDLAITIDVTRTGDTPEAPKMAVSLGGGPAIKVKDRGMLSHPVVKNLLIETARKARIPYQLEVLEGGTTDAMAIQVSREGVPTGTLSIPCRYVHTPSEMVDYGDVQNSVKLLVALLSQPIRLE